jgi:hypothetical protein
MADAEDAIDYLARSTRDILTHYMGDNGTKIADCLEEFAGEMPPVVANSTDEGESYRLPPPEKQISWGITRKNGKFVLAILTEIQDSEANRVAERIEKNYGGLIVRRITARAHSSHPAPGFNSSIRRLSPGASIGHVSGYPGTIGAFVRSTRENENWTGVISASHVLGRNNKAKDGEIVISPGHPDGPKSCKNQVGTLDRFIYLTHFDEDDDPHGNYLCCPDVALVRLLDDKKHRYPDVTFVNSPEDPHNLMPIREVLGGDSVADRLEQQVYKMGRTTGLTRGVLEIIGLQRQPIRIDDKQYIYTNVLAVSSDDGKPFSKPGDSGALVYTADGYAIGLVIAGTDQVSYVSPLDACLRDIEATLLQ